MTKFKILLFVPLLCLKYVSCKSDFRIHKNITCEIHNKLKIKKEDF